MYEELLPIGSVVTVNGASKRLMIIGRIQATTAKREVYDYAACYYPEGLLDSKSILFFNRDDIDLVYFIGFQDPEELQFRTEVLASLGEIYFNEDGQVVERKMSEDEDVARSEAAAEAPETVADADAIEPVVFADV